jgi:hypothetical protein
VREGQRVTVREQISRRVPRAAQIEAGKKRALQTPGDAAETRAELLLLGRVVLPNRGGTLPQVGPFLLLGGGQPRQRLRVADAGHARTC